MKLNDIATYENNLTILRLVKLKLIDITTYTTKLIDITTYGKSKKIIPPPLNIKNNKYPDNSKA